MVVGRNAEVDMVIDVRKVMGGVDRRVERADNLSRRCLTKDRFSLDRS